VTATLERTQVDGASWRTTERKRTRHARAGCRERRANRAAARDAPDGTRDSCGGEKRGVDAAEKPVTKREWRMYGA